MNDSTEKPTDEHHGRQREDEPEQEEASAGPRWHVRLKQKLKARVVLILDAGIASLNSLKSRAGGEEQKREERVVGKQAAEPKQSLAVTLPKSRLRRFLIYVMLMLMTAIIGMTFAYSLLSRVLSDQFEKIRMQKEEIKAYSVENQEKAARIAELMKQVDNQRASLTDAEKRLSETALKEMERKAAEKIIEPTKPLAKPEAPRSAVARTGQPSQASTFRSSIPVKAGNCDVTAGTSPEDLKRCIDNFNRK